jgi:cyclohexanecarboxylate-CoA ligase
MMKFRRDGWWRDQNFLDDLRQSVAKRPNHTALLAHRAGRASTVSYAELSRLTDRIARGLLDLGVRPGEFVGIQLPNIMEMLPLTLACIRIGARVSAVNAAYRRREIEFMFTMTGVRVFVTVDRLGNERPARTGLELPSIEHVVVVGGDGPEGTLSFEEHLLGSGGAPDGKELGPDEPFLVLFTSGTTGEPKGALHSQNTLYAAIRGYQDALGLDDGLVKITPHSVAHYVGLVQGLLAPLTFGGASVVADVWDPAGYLDLIERHRVTMLYAAPNFVREILEAQRARPRDVSALRHVVSGSAPVPPLLADQVRETFGVGVHSLWGMTENGPVTMTRPDDPPDWAARSDGRPIGGMRTLIRPIDGRDDGIGSLWVRGPAQCLGYYGRDDLYAKELDDGWFNTGDLARDDGRGGVRIAGRAKDIIIHASFNVPVADIEALLDRHPRVADVALIGIPDAAVGERVCAVVVPAGEPPTLDELRDRLREAGVTGVFWPERLELLDALPRTAIGKVRKVELRKRYGPR